MAVTSRDLHRRPTRAFPTPQRSGRKTPWLGNYHQSILYALLLILFVTSALPVLVEQGRIKLDDLRYGQPRTTHLSAYIGRGEEQGLPTHFMALNLNQRVVVFVMPGGDSTHAQVLNGPYLFGAREHLTPIALRVEDVNKDGLGDLMIGAKHEEVIYVNTGETFRLITGEERQALIKEVSP